MKNPTDIARETLKLLAQRKTTPTPENYQRIYHEIAGTIPEADALVAMQGALRELAKSSPALEKQARAAEEALLAKKWKELAAMLGGAALPGKAGTEAGNWATTIRELIRQWDAKQVGVTTARKRESLERVLINFGNDPALPLKLQGMMKSWGEAPAGGAGLVEAMAESPEAGPATARLPTALEPVLQGTPDDVADRLRELLVQVLENGVIAKLGRAPELAGEGKALVQMARRAQGQESWEKFSGDLKKFWYKLEMQGESDTELLQSLLRLLTLMVENIGELVEDDKWLQGQVAVVREIIAQPLNRRSLADAERSFKEVVFKQGGLKHSLVEAKATLKNMISVFVERLGEVSTATGAYHDKIGDYMEKITQTEDIPTLNRLLEGLMADTKGIQVDMLRSRDEMDVARKQAEEAEQRIIRLEKELEEVSGKVREDQLTGMLNRRGLEESMQREVARAERQKKSLCVAVLDLDNFKRLNDTYGHQAGDEALQHLSAVLKATMRPTDVVARYGGEEFVILLPETPLEEAGKVITRLQRELTKRFFLHDNEKLLITFSAGVAAYASGESQESVIQRADQAMYQAKKQGKNRVVLSE
ncbi:MAG: GGDEF domain-containing protein [Pseudomonadota bacterium]